MEDNQTTYVGGLLSGELNASGASVQSFADNASVDYTFQLSPSTHPSVVRVEVPFDAVAKDGNRASRPTDLTIGS